MHLQLVSICGFFYDAFRITDSIAANGRVIGELRMRNELEAIIVA
jgi:K+/H+ antiporter YhaU regulatory subunit KhtT